MVDVYTKIVLTVIAGALVVICIQNTVSPAVALGEGCGSIPREACYVRTGSTETLSVREY
jgi:hypothetical protein